VTGVRGRRPGAADTRGHILDVATSEFARLGYDGASMRGIARVAEVDPALVHHYFGSKEKLFTTALRLPIEPGSDLPEVLEGDPAELGTRFARFFLRAWSDPSFREPMLAMLRSATTSERGATMLREFVSSALLARVADAVGTPDAALRANVAAAQLVGVAMLRHVVRIEPLASAPEEDVVALVAPTLQRYLVEGT
jgi:AcrR family transcriptional regulator